MCMTLNGNDRIDHEKSDEIKTFENLIPFEITHTFSSEYNPLEKSSSTRVNSTSLHFHARYEL